MRSSNSSSSRSPIRDFAGPQVNLGLLYVRASRFADAEAAFKAALQRNPDNAVASDELGIVRAQARQIFARPRPPTSARSRRSRTTHRRISTWACYTICISHEPQKALEQFEHYLTLAGENKQVAGWVIELRKRVGAPAPAAKKEPA